MNTLEIESELARTYGYKPLSLDLSAKYRQIFIDNIPDFLNINGDNKNLYTLSGTLVCNGYDRIVVGDYGAFIEYSIEQAVKNNYIVKEGQEYRINDPKYSKNVKYHWYTTKDDSNIKIYWQRKRVNYADYKRNKYYVSVHEVQVRDFLP